MPQEQEPGSGPDDPGSLWTPPGSGPGPAGLPGPPPGLPADPVESRTGSGTPGFQDPFAPPGPYAQGPPPTQPGPLYPGPLYPGQLYPQPARPPRRAAWIIGSVAVLVTAIVAGSAGYVIGSNHDRISASVQNLKADAAGPCPSGQAAPGPAATSAQATGLLARLLPKPLGARLVDVRQGAMSLDAYVNDLYSGDSFEKQRIADRCFQGAASRDWISGSGQVAIWLVQFANASDARSYTLSTQQSDLSDIKKRNKYSIAGVTDSMAIEQPQLDKYGNTLTRLIADHGNVAIIMHFYVPGQVDRAAATALLRRQFAKLG